MSRLTIDLTDEQHKRLKATAALEGKTIRQFAVERLFNGEVWTSDELAAWSELNVLLTERIENAEKNGFSNRTIDDIFDEVLAEDQDKAA